MNYNKICVFDFETDGTNVDTLNPVQLAAVIVDPRKLELVKGGEFNSFIKPETFDEPDYYDKNRSTIEWHANIRDCSVKDIMTLWENSPSQKSVWANFISFLDKFHMTGKRKSKFTAPIACGYNILGFDMPIIKRLSKKHSKGKEVFHPRDKIDLMHWMFPWFENSDEVSSFSMDNMRQYFGMSKAGAHDALKDVCDTAELFCRFQNLHRRTAKKVRFRGAFSRG
jgi:DNA polymerase III epsilon subunit-like protein